VGKHVQEVVESNLWASIFKKCGNQRRTLLRETKNHGVQQLPKATEAMAGDPQSSLRPALPHEQFPLCTPSIFFLEYCVYFD